MGVHVGMRSVAVFVLAAGPLLLGAGESGGEAWEIAEAWVSFRDKGVRTEGQLRAALDSLEKAFDERAVHRRRLKRTRPGLFDEHDLPLEPAYLEGVRSTGAELRVESRWLNGLTVLGTREQLSQIAEFPFVLEVSDVRPYRPEGRSPGRVPRDPDLKGAPDPAVSGFYGWSKGQVEQLGLDVLHKAGYWGAGIRIAVIDTGFLLDHPAFQHPGGGIDVVAQWDFMENDPVASPEPGDAVDQHEHGTVVLGALASNRPGELVGSAPGAEYILLKAEDSDTEYFLEERWFAAALEFAESNGADVVSSSVVLYDGYNGSDVDGRTSVMARAWALAIENGVVGLQGGGNSGHDSIPSTHHLLPPAGVPGVITVGAVDAGGKVAPFSSDGLAIGGTVKPELLALGLGTSSISPYVPGGYTASGGTSMATPVLAGAVACLLQAHPDWTVEEVRSALFESGHYYRRHGEPDPFFIQGFGIPDFGKAAGLPPILDTPLPDPTYSSSPAGSRDGLEPFRDRSPG